MRDGWLLTARLLLRPDGLAGLLAVGGGVLLLTAAAAGWFELRSEVALLGHTSEETIATWHPLPRSAAGWVLLTVGITAVTLGGKLALDRPLPRTLPLLAGTTAAAVLAGLTIGLRPPRPESIAAVGVQELTHVAEQLPAGIDQALRVTTAGGPLLAALGVVLLAVGTAGARDV